LYGAFESMRGRRVSLVESMRIGLRRFFPVLGVALLAPFLTMLAGLAFVIPAFIVITMVFVAIPACVVERLGPLKSIGRSAQLTKGHRWKIFGLLFATLIAAVIAGGVLGVSAIAIGGLTGGIVVRYLWDTVWSAFYAVLVVVTYHDLRVAKEG